MNYLSLYRKYRPKSFNDVVGQEFVVQILKNSIKNNKVANAYVFAGIKGTGKTSIAKIFANAINCLDNKDGDLCGKCEVCQDFANNQVMDVVELDAASNSGVDNVREINDAAVVLPARLNKKVYIIDEAHMLTKEAWNALLKTVEEPPKHVVFIFATTEMHKIPTTILSRCQCFTFNKIKNEDIVKLLVKVCKAENFEYELEALQAIADIVDGSARDALSILEQTSTYGDNKIKVDDIYKVFGIMSSKQLVEFVNLWPTNNNVEIFTKLNQLFSTGINFVNFCNLLVSILTDKIVYLKTKNYQLMTKANENIINSFAINDINKLIKLLDIWQETYFKVSVPTDVKVIIEHAVLKSLAILNESEIVVEQQPEVKPQQTIVQPKMVTPTMVHPKPVEVKPQEETTDKIIPLDKIFSFGKTIHLTPTKKVELKQSEPKQEVKKEPTSIQSIEIKMPSAKEILLACASNRNKDEKVKASKALQDIKEGDISDTIFSTVALASQVVFASPNCIVLAFEDELDAKILNKTSKDKDFILGCCKIFCNPKFVVGFSLKQINDMKAEIQQAMKQQLPLLNVEALRDILNKDASIEQIAWNVLIKE